MLANGQFGSGFFHRAAGTSAEDMSAASGEEKSKKTKRKRPKFIRKVECQVCNDVANDHVHYGAIACYSCRAFFRRGVNSNAPYYCSQDKQCLINKHTRKHCQYCRFQKCLNVGMKGSWVMTEDDKKEKKEKALLRRLHKVKKEDIPLNSNAPSTSSNYSFDTLENTFTTYPNGKNSPKTSTCTNESIMLPQQNMCSPGPSSASPLASPSPSSSDYNRTPSPNFSNYSRSSCTPVYPRMSTPAFTPNNASDLEKELSNEYNLSCGNHVPPRPHDYVSSPCSTPPPPSCCPPESTKNDFLVFSPSNSSLDSISNVDTNSTSREVVSSFFFRTPSPTTKLPIMTFTSEENNLVQSVINTELDTTRSIPVNPAVIMSMVQAARTGSVIPYKDLLEGYTVCMKRIIKFASKLDFFQGLGHEDQRNLLLANTDMIVNIRSARLLRPTNNLQIQIEHAVGGAGLGTNTKALEPYKERLEYRQVYQSPWACDEDHEKKFACLMENLFHLEMDKVTTMLMSLIVLFSCNNAKLKDRVRCTHNQEFFSHMLYRYLVSTVGRTNAIVILPKYMFLISQLEEMAQIMVTKRLML